MDIARAAFAALVAAGALAAGGAARSAEPETVATAPATPPGAASVADQIDAYLKTSPARSLPRDGPDGVTTGDEPRKAHGFVDVTVGSSGYRSAYVQGDLPVGRTGSLSIGVGETRFKGRSWGGFGGGFGGGLGAGYGGYGGRFAQDRQSLALGLSLGGDAPSDPLDPRCGPPGEDGADLRQDRRIEGARQRACQSAGAPRLP